MEKVDPLRALERPTGAPTGNNQLSMGPLELLITGLLVAVAGLSEVARRLSVLIALYGAYLALAITIST